VAHLGHVTGHDDGKPSRVPTWMPQAFIMCIEIESSDPRVLSYGPGTTVVESWKTLPMMVESWTTG